MGVSTVEDYLAGVDEARRPTLESLRAAVKAAAPEAIESIAYDMPALRTRDGRFIVSFAAYKRHYSLFPASDAVREALGDEIAPYLAGRGTIRFKLDEPLPTDLVTRVVRIRVTETA